MLKRYDLTGQTFSRLTVIEHYGKNKRNENLWKCRCICGNETVTLSTNLKQGNTRSCGCLQKEKATKQLMDITITHGLSKDINGKKTRLYRIWSGIKSRCLDVNVLEYPRYGGRGVAICDEWKDDFKSFYSWSIANGYKEDLEVDRIDNDGNYEPSNCRWVTQKKQANNRRNNKLVTYEGETKTLAEWARCAGLDYHMFWARLKRGWSFERAITTPALTQGGKPKPEVKAKKAWDDRNNNLRVEVQE